MATIFEDLTKVFDAPLVQFGLDNDITVRLENIKSPTDIGDPYLSGQQFTGVVDQADLALFESRLGFYQVSIFFPQHKGSASLNRMADLLNAAFKTGQELTRNSVCVTIQAVEISNLIVANGWASRALTINWQVNTARI